MGGVKIVNLFKILLLFLAVCCHTNALAQGRVQGGESGQVADGRYVSEFTLNVRGNCGELPLKIEITVIDLFFQGNIINESNHAGRACREYHTGKIQGKFYANGDIDKFDIEPRYTRSRMHGAYMAVGSLHEAVLISKSSRYHPDTKFSLKLAESAENNKNSPEQINSSLKNYSGTGFTKNGNEWLLLIKFINNYTEATLIPKKCKKCSNANLNEKIVCDKDKNLFQGDRIDCTVPSSARKNDVDLSAGNSILTISCNGSTSCNLNVKLVSDQNAKKDINVLTIMGNSKIDLSALSTTANDIKNINKPDASNVNEFDIEQDLIEQQKNKEVIKEDIERNLIETAEKLDQVKKQIETELVQEAKKRNEEEQALQNITKQKISEWSKSDLKLLLEDMEKFVSQNKKSLDAITLIKLLRPVKEIENKNNFIITDIDKINSLNTFLMKNEEFSSYRNEKILEREGERLRQLSLKQGELQKLLDFCMAYITNNTLADESYELTILYKDNIDNVKNGDQKSVEQSINNINKKLINLGLKEDSTNKKDKNDIVIDDTKDKEVKTKKRIKIAIPQEKPEIEKEVKKGLENNNEAKNVKSVKILKKYQDDDILIYLNLLGTAPHSYRDLEGNIKFENKIINICWAHEIKIDATYNYYLKIELEKKYPDHIISLNETCSLGDFNKLNNTYDGIILLKKLFLKHNYSKIENIINNINDKNYIQDFVLTFNEFNKYLSKREILSTQIEEDILDGNRNGFGSILIENNSNIVCLIADEKLEAHKGIIMRGNIFEEYQLLKGKKLESVVEVSLDNGFIQTQRGNCGLLYAVSADLAKLYKAIKNVRIKYQTIPDWVSLKDVDKTYASILDKENKEAVDNAKRVAAEKLRKSEEDARRKKDLIDAKEKQAELRRTYNPRVSSILDEFESLMFKENMYPKFVSWFDMKNKSGWEEDKKNRSININDYGSVIWGTNRTLEADIINVTLSLINKDQGLKKDHCFVFLKIVDLEFDRYREMLSSECEGSNKYIDRWKKSFSFTSLWNVEVLNN